MRIRRSCPRERSARRMPSELPPMLALGTPPCTTEAGRQAGGRAGTRWMDAGSSNFRKQRQQRRLQGRPVGSHDAGVALTCR